MKGIERLSAVESSTPRMARALPDMPMAPTAPTAPTAMVRLIRISAFGLGNLMSPSTSIDTTQGRTGNG